MIQEITGWIWRWNNDGIEVVTSVQPTKKKCEEWAIKWLRPWDMSDDGKARKYVLANGKAIKNSPTGGKRD